MMHDPFTNRLCEKQYNSGRSKSCRRSRSGWDCEGKYSCQEWSSASYLSATYGCRHNSEAVPRSKFTDNWISVSTPLFTSLLDLCDELNNSDFSMLLVPLGWKKLVPVVYKIFQNSPEVAAQNLACAGGQGKICLQFSHNKLMSLDIA